MPLPDVGTLVSVAPATYAAAVIAGARPGSSTSRSTSNGVHRQPVMVTSSSASQPKRPAIATG